MLSSRRVPIIRSLDGDFSEVDTALWVTPKGTLQTRNKVQTRRKPVRWLTEGLSTTYRRCNPEFFFKPNFTMSRRVLTNPSIPRHNSGFDNENYDLIMHVGDVLGSAVAGEQSEMCWKKGTRYTIVEMLGQGTFGQVVKCRDEEQGTLVAVKVLKNKLAYFRQGLLEIGILTAVNTNCDPDGSKNTLRILGRYR